MNFVPDSRSYNFLEPSYKSLLLPHLVLTSCGVQHLTSWWRDYSQSQVQYTMSLHSGVSDKCTWHAQNFNMHILPFTTYGTEWSSNQQDSWCKSEFLISCLQRTAILWVVSKRAEDKTARFCPLAQRGPHPRRGGSIKLYLLYCTVIYTQPWR